MHNSALVAFCLLMLGSYASAQLHERRINAWLVNGPWPNPDNKALDDDFLQGEAGVRPGLGEKTNGKAWVLMDDRLYCRNQDDYVDLFTFFMPDRPGSPTYAAIDTATSHSFNWPPPSNQLNTQPATAANEHVAAYVHTYVWSATAGDYKLMLGASDGLKAWLNGRQVVSDLPQAERQPMRDEHSYPIHLESGWNSLLIKTANDFRIWGFYAKIADTNGESIDGLEYSIDKPEGVLAITTLQLPRAYTGWPYVWLTCNGLPKHQVVPSASPFRLMAKGGTPPYSFQIVDGQLPASMKLEANEGEITGYCPQTVQNFPFTLEVRDAAGATVRASLTLTMAERPTRWLEAAKLGSLIHGSNIPPGYMHGEPHWQAATMAREGIEYGMSTLGYNIGREEWPGEWIGNPAKTKFNFLREEDHMAAYKAAGVRYGSYLALTDARADVYASTTTQFLHWARYNDFLHRYFEEWFRYARPATIYLDGAGPAPAYVPMEVFDARNTGFDYDALWSVAKVISPASLIIANSGASAGLDWMSGDCDVFSTEGNNDGYDPVWSRWPSGPSGRNPKRMPNETWRYPFSTKPYGDFINGWAWANWTRSVVCLICEGYICNLDHSSGHGRNEMHEKIADWLGPRLDSLKGTRPGPLFDQAFGYTVYKGNLIFVHILESPRGKRGLRGAHELILEPLNDRVKTIKLIPSGSPVPFRQFKNRVSVDFKGVTETDAVDTILRVEMEQNIATSE